MTVFSDNLSGYFEFASGIEFETEPLFHAC
jgi:hypothetical protein